MPFFTNRLSRCFQPFCRLDILHSEPQDWGFCSRPQLFGTESNEVPPSSIRIDSRKVPMDYRGTITSFFWVLVFGQLWWHLFSSRRESVGVFCIPFGENEALANDNPIWWKWRSHLEYFASHLVWHLKKGAFFGNDYHRALKPLKNGGGEREWNGNFCRLLFIYLGDGDVTWFPTPWSKTPLFHVFLLLPNVYI